MTTGIAARLAKVEAAMKEKGIGEPPVMHGAIEVHCTGGRGRVEGELCLEHEDCVFHSTPILGRIRRQIIFDWFEGMTSLDTFIG